jgi:hypothetical protein
MIFLLNSENQLFQLGSLKCEYVDSTVIFVNLNRFSIHNVLKQ